MSNTQNDGRSARRWQVWNLTAGIGLAVLMAGAGAITQAAPVAAAQPTTVEVEQTVRDTLAAGGSPDVIVRFRGKADLSAAFAIAGRDTRATYVYGALTNLAAQKQASVLQMLQSQFNRSASRTGYTVLWIDNSIAIPHITEPLLDKLTASADVESVRLDKPIPLPQEPTESAPWVPHVAVSSLVHIKVPDVWALGYKGAGVVVANIDAGVRYTHEALVDKYRGNNGGGGFDHEHNWYDPYQHSSEPRTTSPHGSHTMGTMVGDGGGDNQIGAAPDAKWIACIGFGDTNGSATASGLLECGQWVLAPYATDGSGAPDPAAHADIVNNSWGDCATTFDNGYEGVVDSWIAAGMVPVFSNGNAPNCGLQDNPPLNTVGNPARSGKVLGVGATGTNNGQYAPFSMKGPTDNPNPGLPDYPDPAGYADLKPNLVAPGVDIYSATDAADDQYVLDSGTSMSAPAVAGVIALMWSAAPCLHGNYGISGSLLMHAATAIPFATGSPSDGPGNVPNQATGWGEVDALASVNAAIAYCQAGGAYPPTVNKSFDPAVIKHDTDSVLTIGLANATTGDATLSAALTDTLPAGIVISATPAASTTCANANVQATAGGTSVSINAGTKIPADSRCEIKVSVTSASNGDYANTIAVGALQTNIGNNVTAANATLHVTENGQVFPLPYCPATFGRGVEPITRVVFAGIDNTSSATTAGAAPMDDFTGISGDVRIGATLPITIEGNTNGAYTDYVSVYFDWNHDGFFSEGEETILLGSITDSNGTDGKQLSGSVFVPMWATPGDTRMRVVKRYGGYADRACNTNTGFGQSEDYSISIAPSDNLSLPSVAASYVPPRVPVGANSVVKVELINPNAKAIAVTADLTDTLPAGLIVTDASTTCSNAEASVSGGGTAITLLTTPGNPTDIVTIPGNGSCVLSATVQAPATGDYENRIAAGALQTNAGNNAAPSAATLTVTEQNTNGIILSGTLDHTLVHSTSGTSLNIVGSVFDDSGAGADFLFYSLNDTLTLLRMEAAAGTYLVDGGGKAKLLMPGDVVGPSQSFGHGALTVEMAAGWLAGTDGYLGVQFNCDGRLPYPVPSTLCYGYVHITTQGPGGYPAIVLDTGFDGDGQAITVPGVLLNAPSATLTPATLNFTVAADYSATQTLNIANAAGSKPMNYVIAARNPAKSSIASESRTAALGNGGVTLAHTASPWIPQGSLVFSLDDGTAEFAFGSDVSIIYINRFTPPDGTGAFTIDSISILWPGADLSQGDLTGKQVKLLVYYDADGDGNPANAERIDPDTDIMVTIDTPGSFQAYPLTLDIPGAGDVYIGFQDTFQAAGGGQGSVAAALDTTASASRSYIATNVVDEPDADNLGNNEQLGELGALSQGAYDGNWTIRATGTAGGTGGPCTGPVLNWITADPAGGSVSGGRNADVSVSVNPAAVGLAAGNYSAELCLTTNDPLHRLLSVPVSVTVMARTCGADSLFCNGFDPDRAFPQAVQDPGFEATQGDGGFNPSWQASVTESNPDPNAPPPPASPFYLNNVPAHTGTGSVRAGGFGFASTAAWWQSVTIHRGGPRYVNYWRFMLDAPAAGGLQISVDGNVVSSVDLATLGADHDWTAQSADVSAYADDNQHTVRFDYVATTGVDGNVYFDDITIDPSPIAPLGAKPH